MSKTKRMKRSSRAEAVPASAPPASAPGADSSVTSAPSRPQPVGQRLWDMPYSAVAPRLVSPELGLHNVVSRAGHNAGYDIDVTLLDAPDHRLIRSGVLLAHRVLEGRGEWYVGAPDWVPLLPKERIDSMSQADLPDDLGDVVRPFRRLAALGPVAALRCERREFSLRDAGGTTLALVRDDKVTVRRGGLTTARYREVMMTPVGPGLSGDQGGFLEQAMAVAGATPVEKFPRLVTRLGAPSNGPTDFPLPHPLGPEATFAQFVSSLLARRLRELLEADLRVRNDEREAVRTLGQHAEHLRQEIDGLSSVLDPRWTEDLVDGLDWLIAEADGQDAPLAVRSVSTPLQTTPLHTKLRGERYLTLLERLVTAARAPKAGDSSQLPAGDVIDALADSAQRRLTKKAGRLATDSSTEAWVQVRRAIEELARVDALARALSPADLARHELVAGLQDAIGDAWEASVRASRTHAAVGTATPAEAFELGRRYEREIRDSHSAREAFLTRWAKTAKKLARRNPKLDQDAHAPEVD